MNAYGNNASSMNSQNKRQKMNTSNIDGTPSPTVTKYPYLSSNAVSPGDQKAEKIGNKVNATNDGGNQTIENSLCDDDAMSIKKSSSENGFNTTGNSVHSSTTLADSEHANLTDDQLQLQNVLKFHNMEDPFTWKCIVLNDDLPFFGPMRIDNVRVRNMSYTELHDAEDERKNDVLCLAQRMFRYRQIAVAWIRKNSLERCPDVYIKHELFAEKIGALAYRVAIDKKPIHLMSAQRINMHMNLKNPDLAIFIERMAFYEESMVKFDFELTTHNVKQVMVVHKSSNTEHEMTVIYKWKKHYKHESD